MTEPNAPVWLFYTAKHTLVAVLHSQTHPCYGGDEVSAVEVVAWWCDEGDGVAWMVMMLLVGITIVRWCGDDGDDDGVEMV
ncbi:hypothetical protein Tco_0244000, partial [Tanacetum coccineum]